QTAGQSLHQLAKASAPSRHCCCRYSQLGTEWRPSFYAAVCGGAPVFHRHSPLAPVLVVSTAFVAGTADALPHPTTHISCLANADRRHTCRRQNGKLSR